MFHQFDDIYCINLDDRTDRWETFLKNNSEFIDCRVKRFSAVDTRHLNYHHIGCALSHRRIIQEAKDRGLENVLVFEDDAIVHPENLHVLKNFDHIRQDFDLLYLGSFHWTPDVYEVVSKNVLRVKDGMMCLHAICYSKKSYDQILERYPDNLEHLTNEYHDGQFEAIDSFLMTQWQHKNKDAYLFWPRPFGGNWIDHEENRPQIEF